MKFVMVETVAGRPVAVNLDQVQFVRVTQSGHWELMFGGFAGGVHAVTVKVLPAQIMRSLEAEALALAASPDVQPPAADVAAKPAKPPKPKAQPQPPA